MALFGSNWIEEHKKQAEDLDRPLLHRNWEKDNDFDKNIFGLNQESEQKESVKIDDGQMIKHFQD